MLAGIVGCTLTQLASKQVKPCHAVGILAGQLAKEVIDSLRSHLGDKLLGIIVGKQFVALWQLVVYNINIIILTQQVELLGTNEGLVVHVLHSLNHARLDDNVFFIVDDLL